MGEPINQSPERTSSVLGRPAGGPRTAEGRATEDAGFLILVGQEMSGMLNALMERLEFLLSDDLSLKQRHHALGMQSFGKELLTIVNDIIDFSRIEIGEFQLQNIEFDLHTTVLESAARLKESARAKRDEIVCLIHHDVPRSVRGDPSRLRQILTNFISNVMRSANGEEILLRAKVEEASGGSMRIRFEVNESGSPTAEGSMGGAPTEFSHEIHKVTPGRVGSGIGFAISKRLAESMNGSFGIETGPGQTHTIWFTVRLGNVAADPIDDSVPRSDLRCVRALAVVNDDASYQNLVAHTLSWGMTCDMALGPDQALEKLRLSSAGGSPYDLALLDTHMAAPSGLTEAASPEGDGLELARAIHNDPALASVRPVMMIAVGLRGQAEMAHQAGIQGYLTKPVNQSDLYNCLVTVMGERGKSRVGEARVDPPLVTSHSLKEEKARHVPRVLVAEDNTVNQMVVVRMLEKLGYQTDVAVNGREAVEACGRSHYDLVLMDCQMPEMDGFAATKAILASEKEKGGTHLPIIAVTANAMQGDREKCLAAGMDDYISKPFKLDQIRAVVARWLSPPTAPAAAPLVAAAAAGSSEASAIDSSVLADFQVRPGDGLPDFLVQLRAQFLVEAQARMSAIEAAVHRSDAAALKQAAHALKGSSSVIGAKSLAAVCAQLEDRAKSGVLNDAATLSNQLENELGRVRRELAPTARR